MKLESYQNIKVHIEENEICYIQINRLNQNNTINHLLIKELQYILDLCKDSIKIMVLEGFPEVFCNGVDFNEISREPTNSQVTQKIAEPLYEVCLQLANGPYITIAHARGRSNAGGIGLIAACDITIAEEFSFFSLSELLFGLFPACVLPFLIRRIGFQKAHYMTLMTKPIAVQEAHTWGLIDEYYYKGEFLLNKYLLRLKCLSKISIINYKKYITNLNQFLITAKTEAIKANKDIFEDSVNLTNIIRYVKTNKFPWEK